MGKFKDLTNQKFNRLLFIEKTDNRDKSGNVIWRCQCDCGNNVLLSARDVTRQNTKSCGCLYKSQDFGKRKAEDITNTKFGRLLAIKRLGYIKKHSLWKCICDCGKEVNVSLNHLKSGNSKSCGCCARGNQTQGTIYGIYDNKNELVYIGKTIKHDINNRLSWHIKKPRGKMKTWLSSINYRPDIKPLIENVKLESLDIMERQLIKLVTKEYHSLLNTNYHQ